MNWFSATSPAFLLVVVSTAAMFAVAIFLLVTATRLRRANSRKSVTWSKFEPRVAALLDRLADGEVDAREVRSHIDDSEKLLLLDYLYKSAVQESDPHRLNLFRSIARPYLPLLARRARTGDAWQRARAIRSLAELAGPTAAATIRHALDDRAPHVAMTAARAYAQLRLGGVESLLERIERYQNWDRRLLRAVLVSFGADAAPALHRYLADRQKPVAARAVCADALSVLGYTAAADDAAAVLATETDVDLIAACLRLMSAPATDRQLRIVRDLCSSTDEIVRTQAIGCLGRIGGDSDVAVVQSALRDTSPWVARSARAALAGRGINVDEGADSQDAVHDGGTS